MSKPLKYLIPVISLFAVTGCAALAGLISPPSSTTTGSTASTGTTVASSAVSMFDEVELSSRILLLSPQALLDDNVYLEGDIIHSQCEFHSADPPVLVPTIEARKGWVFTGRLNQDNRVGMQSLEYRSFFGFGWPKQQLNTWPVSMVTLAQLPEVYLDQNLPMFAGVKINQSQQDEITRSFFGDSAKIQDTMKRLEISYNPQTECVAEK